MISRNLAGILLHHQKNLLNTRSPIQPIKFSFIPSAPGAPSKLNSARIDLRFVSRRLCSLVGSAAPWSTKGLFRERHGKVTLTFRSLHTPMEPGTKCATGHLTMSRESESLKLRADFLIQTKTGGHDIDGSLETGDLRVRGRYQLKITSSRSEIRATSTRGRMFLISFADRWKNEGSRSTHSMRYRSRI